MESQYRLRRKLGNKMIESVAAWGSIAIGLLLVAWAAARIWNTRPLKKDSVLFLAEGKKEKK